MKSSGGWVQNLCWTSWAGRVKLSCPSSVGEETLGSSSQLLTMYALTGVHYHILPIPAISSPVNAAHSSFLFFPSIMYGTTEC